MIMFITTALKITLASKYDFKKTIDLDILEHSKNMERMGAGEIIINSIDNDGVMDTADADDNDSMPS
jgi:imidazole glycerol phosphate synthase subunit HisF